MATLASTQRSACGQRGGQLRGQVGYNTQKSIFKKKENWSCPVAGIELPSRAIHTMKDPKEWWYFTVGKTSHLS
jgi:hypothetical protein